MPKLILVPLTVPTIAYPSLESAPVAEKAITTLLELLSKAASMCATPSVPLKAAIEPKLMLLPLTVPTTAFPSLPASTS